MSSAHVTTRTAADAAAAIGAHDRLVTSVRLCGTVDLDELELIPPAQPVCWVVTYTTLHELADERRWPAPPT